MLFIAFTLFTRYSLLNTVGAVSLSTLVKVSSVSTAKTRVRNESEFVLELVRRTVRNSNPEDVYIYDSLSTREFNPTTGRVDAVNANTDFVTLYSKMIGANTDGNEIHFRPYGYDKWICIGFFYSTESEADENGVRHGYILKTTKDSLQNAHESCFASGRANQNYIILNSATVAINDFNIAYTETTTNDYLIRFDLEAESLNWYLGNKAPVQNEVFRQTVVQNYGLHLLQKWMKLN